MLVVIVLVEVVTLRDGQLVFTSSGSAFIVRYSSRCYCSLNRAGSDCCRDYHRGSRRHTGRTGSWILGSTELLCRSETLQDARNLSVDTAFAW
jgi:hypothetical protein